MSIRQALHEMGSERLQKNHEAGIRVVKMGLSLQPSAVRILKYEGRIGFPDERSRQARKVKARTMHLAYAAMRGVPYAKTEPDCYSVPDFDEVVRVVSKNTNTQIPAVKAALQAWVNDAKYYLENGEGEDAELDFSDVAREIEQSVTA